MNRIFFWLTLVLAFCLSACTAGATPTPIASTTLPTLVSPTDTVALNTPPPTSTRVAPTATAESTRAPAALTPRTQPTPSTTARQTRTGDSALFGLDIAPIADEFTRPVFITNAGDDSNRLFVLEQQGRIYFLNAGSARKHLFLDLREIVNDKGNEQGLLGLAFHPDYKNNGKFYVDYTNLPNGDTVIAQYQVSSNPDKAEPNSAQILLTIDQPEPNHNGGMLAFGPDGYLYIGTGDGGGAGDLHGDIGNGQSRNTLLGKILRLDVNNAPPYQIPPSNPFVNTADARPEIWAYGLRNPWRFSFDRATGDLYIADVGQGTYEEINFQPAASGGGENYGWRTMEGNHCFRGGDSCNTAGLTRPITEYTHDLGCSVTGGYVYRGQAFAWLQGYYLFADYCTGIVWATRRDTSGAWQTRQVTTFDDTISSFGQDEQGELYIAGHKSGTVYKLTSQAGP